MISVILFFLGMLATLYLVRDSLIGILLFFFVILPAAGLLLFMFHATGGIISKEELIAHYEKHSETLNRLAVLMHESQPFLYRQMASLS